MTRASVVFSALALGGWLVCFGILDATGAWTPFALLGLALAALGVLSGAVSRELLRPSLRAVTWGALGGALMVLATHVAYAAIVKLMPAVGAATRELFALLNIPGVSPGARAALVTWIAACEELVFRGLLFSGRAAQSSAVPTSAELGRIVVLTVAYALTTLPLGSPLLTVCALVCGGLWAAMGVASGSLLTPVLAHALWDLGVLCVWPLV